jgi:hypothetical protein
VFHRYWFDSMLDRVSKVTNLSSTIFAEEDIFGFDIEMDDIICVKVLQAAANIHPYLIGYIF